MSSDNDQSSDDIVTYRCYECGQEDYEMYCFYREEFYHVLCDECYEFLIAATGGYEDEK